MVLLHALASLSASIALSPLPPDTSIGPVPALEIIKVYGSLAGPECYGRVAPPGSSCQLPLSYLEKELGLGVGVDNSASLSRNGFRQRVESLPFQWPLKPFGLTEDSLRKTAIMNKGAETALFMDELEGRGLFDRRNPTGPLPTSLRPKLNALLEIEGVDRGAADRAFSALSGGREEITAEGLKEAYRGEDSLDYYGFIELVGNENISWPRKER